MKYICLIASFIVFTGASYAQDNLKFSRVIWVKDSTYTVPTGKVWKMESLFIQINKENSRELIGICNGQNKFLSVIINGGFYFVEGRELKSFPFWLPAGTKISSSCYSWWVTGVEYTITN
ncbi:MAG: hypothetical protein KF706_10815 [Chitinophagales bacterium]|nr:hypothetical protein [Chitinophagales bacterium]